MKRDQFIKLICAQEGFTTNPVRMSDYYHETGRRLPAEIHNGNHDSMLFVAWFKDKLPSWETGVPMPEVPHPGRHKRDQEA